MKIIFEIDHIVSIDGNPFLSGKMISTDNGVCEKTVIRIPITIDVCNRIMLETTGEFLSYIGHPDVERDAALYME